MIVESPPGAPEPRRAICAPCRVFDCVVRSDGYETVFVDYRDLDQMFPSLDGEGFGSLSCPLLNLLRKRGARLRHPRRGVSNESSVSCYPTSLGIRAVTNCCGAGLTLANAHWFPEP
eukprot:scaffold1690_cov182-Amphora_coffeaeformis.AAC.10